MVVFEADVAARRRRRLRQLLPRKRPRPGWTGRATRPTPAPVHPRLSTSGSAHPAAAGEAAGRAGAERTTATRRVRRGIAARLLRATPQPLSPGLVLAMMRICHFGLPAAAAAAPHLFCSFNYIYIYIYIMILSSLPSPLSPLPSPSPVSSHHLSSSLQGSLHPCIQCGPAGHCKPYPYACQLC